MPYSYAPQFRAMVVEQVRSGRNVEELDLHRAPEGLHGSVVVAVADGAHGTHEAEAPDVLGEGPRRELISFTGISGGAKGQQAHRIDGPGLLCWRQRGDGVLLLAAPEERPRPSALADALRARLRDRRLDRAHLQPPSPSARTRQAHPR